MKNDIFRFCSVIASKLEQNFNFWYLSKLDGSVWKRLFSNVNI